MERRRIGILCRNHAGSFHVGTDSASLRTDQSLVAGSNRRNGRSPVPELDLVTPHLHHITGLDPEEHRNNARLSHVMLFVMAIALHKLPEGMAAGVSVCSAEGATEWGVSFGIALQNIPEGMVIIAPLMMAGVTAVRTFFISIFIALLEVIGILLGFGLGSASSTFLPVMLGFAGGAMLYVTSDEMIPETHSHGFQKQATYALLLGFITFVLMEKCV